MGVKERITKALESLSPTSLEIHDDSAKHAKHIGHERFAGHGGHAGHAPDGGTHFRVRIVAPVFAGKSRLDRHRAINALLADEFAGSLHMLQIDAKAPGE